MRKSIISISLVLLICTSYAQQLFNSANDVQEHWSNYTSYQKEEMVSFCNFLFQESHYERCILTAFQLLYKFPEDNLSSTLHYYIARSYDELENYVLAERYYSLASRINPDDPITSNASLYRKQLVYLKSNQFDKVIQETEQSLDPYLLTFRGYALLYLQNWEEARSTFIHAEQLFNHSHYNELLLPLYQILDEVETVPRYNKYLVSGIGSVIPGSGHFLLKDWGKGRGVLITVGLLALTSKWTKVTSLNSSSRIIESEGSAVPIIADTPMKGGYNVPDYVSMQSASIKYSVPPILFGVGIYVGSIWKSFTETYETNHQLISFYLQNELSKYSPNRFVDFPEPVLKSVQ